MRSICLALRLTDSIKWFKHEESKKMFLWNINENETKWKLKGNETERNENKRFSEK